MDSARGKLKMLSDPVYRAEGEVFARDNCRVNEGRICIDWAAQEGGESKTSERVKGKNGPFSLFTQKQHHTHGGCMAAGEIREKKTCDDTEGTRKATRVILLTIQWQALIRQGKSS